MRKRRARARDRILRSVLVAGLAAVGALAPATPSLAADTLTLNYRTGPSGGGNSIILTTGNAGDFAGTEVVEFTFNDCTNNWRAGTTPANTSATPNVLTNGIVPVPAGNVRKVATKKLLVVVPKELALVAAPGVQTTGIYHVCVYTVADTAGTLVDDTATGQTYTIAGGMLNLSTYTGPNRGGNTISATTNAAAFASTSVVQFQAAIAPGTEPWSPCNPTYATPVTPTAAQSAPYGLTGGAVDAATVSVIAATATAPAKLTTVIPSGLTLVGPQTAARYNVCVYGARSNTSTLLAQSVLPYTITHGTLGPNLTVGPNGGGNSLTLTTTATAAGTFAAGAVTVQFQYAGIGRAMACAATFQPDAPAEAVATGAQPPAQVAGAATVPPPDVRVLTKNRLVVTVPPGVELDTNPAQLTAAYHICAYTGDTDDSTLIGASDPNIPYSIGIAAVINSISPTAGSAQGGTLITVYGEHFPATLTAADVTIGGAHPASEPLVAANGNSFTVVAPPHPVGGPLSITVTTLGGTTSKSSLFTYTNGIVVMPNTAPASRVDGVTLDIKGVGFDALSFGPTSTGTTPNSINAHVYLVDGVYSPGGGNEFNKRNGQVAECVDALVIAPDELICTLFPAGNGPHAHGANPVTCVSCTVADDMDEVTAAADTFLPTHVGMAVSAGVAGVPAGTTITAVTGPRTVRLSNRVTTTNLAAGVAMTLSPTRVVNDAIITADVGTGALTKLASADANFTSADNGRVIAGPGIASGTTISVDDADNVVLSQPATAPGAALPVTIGAVPVPVGAYVVTIVSNGAIVPAEPLRTTVISSGAVFTVADY